MATDKQTLALTIYVANRGISKAEAMRRAGYADKTARNPKNLTDTKTWQELIAERLPDDALVDVHNELLNAHTIQHMLFPLAMDEGDIYELLTSVGCKPQKIKHSEQAIHVWYWAPDNMVRKAAVELAYKLKGRLTNKIEVSDPDGLFGNDALTIKVVDGRADAQSQAADSI